MSRYRAACGSKRYLWTEQHVIEAVYVEFGQGDVVPSIDTID